MTWQIEFYERSNGRCPTRDFLNNLGVRERVRVNHAFTRLAEYGPELGRPYAAPLRDKIYELRVHTEGGHVRLLYFFFDGQRIIITHGFKKKQSAVPGAEIDTAIRHRADYLEQRVGGEGS